MEGGNGYSYGLERSKRYGVPTKSVSSSSFGLESLGGMEIGTGMGFDRDGILVITRYTEWVASLPWLALWLQGEWAEALNPNLNGPNCKVEQFGLCTGFDYYDGIVVALALEFCASD